MSTNTRNNLWIIELLWASALAILLVWVFEKVTAMM